MAEHVDEIEHDHIEIVVLQIGELAQQLLGAGRVVDLVVGEPAAAAETLELGGYQRRFV